jgi:hypothetical protein
MRAEGESAYEVTPHGVAWLADAMHIEVAAFVGGRRPVARRCPDWMERRPHVAGALGAAILDRLRAMRWVAKIGGSRALRITPRGRDALTRLGLGGALVAHARM